jgi:hypothetical protein
MDMTHPLSLPPSGGRMCQFPLCCRHRCVGEPRSQGRHRMGLRLLQDLRPVRALWHTIHCERAALDCTELVPGLSRLRVQLCSVGICMAAWSGPSLGLFRLHGADFVVAQLASCLLSLRSGGSPLGRDGVRLPVRGVGCLHVQVRRLQREGGTAAGRHVSGGHCFVVERGLLMLHAQPLPGIHLGTHAMF